jgi:regulator of sigma E protease
MSLQTLLAFFFVLGVVIVIHEAGHFLVAKAVGIYCKTFSVGFGKKLLRRRFGETEYALSAIPFGGYVKFAGEGAMEQVQDAGTGEQATDLDADGEPIPEHRYFSSKSTWQRMAVVVAGPLMNLVLALVVTTGVVFVRGVTVNPVTVVGEVAEGSPAAAAGLEVGDRVIEVGGESVDSWVGLLNAIVEDYQRDSAPVGMVVQRGGRAVPLSIEPQLDDDGRYEIGISALQDTRVGLVKKDGPAWNAGLRRGDVILSIDGQEVSTYSEIAGIVNESIDKPLQFVWRRDGREFSASVTPQAAEIPLNFKETETVGRIYYEQYTETRKVSVAQAVRMGSRATWGMVAQTAEFLGALFTGGASGDTVSGPIRIAQFSGEMVRWGFDRLLLFMSMFSVNLFLLNLLPVPVLDGGHAVFILYEMIARRRPPERIQLWATQIGFVALLGLMGWVLVMDVMHVVGG